MSRTVSVLAGLVALAMFASAAHTEGKGDKKVPPVLSFTMKDIDGKEVALSKYQGKVVLFVNVASQCGYTPQYKGLQALHEKYGKDGLAVVGIPSNDFGKQEPGSEEEIKKFCSDKYNVTFDLYSKVVVKGEGQVPLYKYLTSADMNPKFAGPIKWNFSKFLIGRNGEVVGRFESAVKPESAELTRAIEAELTKK